MSLHFKVTVLESHLNGTVYIAQRHYKTAGDWLYEGQTWTESHPGTIQYMYRRPDLFKLEKTTPPITSFDDLLL
jgi:hypothetical protein